MEAQGGGETMGEERLIEIQAVFDQDSKRFHRFTITGGQAVSGSIYIPKGSKIPDLLTIRLLSEGENQKKL